MKMIVRLIVNGEPHDLAIEPNQLLIEVLRDQLGLTGTKHSCGAGNCGACTVLMDGTPILSCMTLAVAARDREITTIEGLAEGEVLHPIQKAFVDHGAIQCGYCTPGMILSAKALLEKKPHPTEEEIREGIAGNICRCTGYTKIVEAIHVAADESAGEDDK